MKSTFALASIAALSQAVAIQEGYVIDLCPTEAQGSAITMAGSEQLLGAAQQEGFMIAPAASTNKWALYREGLAAAAL